MRLKMISAAVASLSLVATPVLAAPINSAASLSVAKSVRASAPTEKRSELAGAGLLGLLIGAGVIAIGVIAIVNDSDDSDSN